MIPKIIHYCWFGQNSKPVSVMRFIDGWRKNLPEYDFIEWNQNNFDCNSTQYSSEAFRNGKYAFVSDVARGHALYLHGGIYLDTDVDVIKPFDRLLNHRSFWGFEAGNYIATSTIGAEKGNELIGEYLDQFSTRKFLRNDGSFDLTTNVVIVTQLLKKRGLILNNKQQMIGNDNLILPISYFSPYDSRTGVHTEHSETIAIHYYSNTWNSSIWFRVKRVVKNTIAKLIGLELSKKIWIRDKVV